MEFRGNIEKLTLHNNNYRKVLNTTKYSQLVLMSIPPKEEIGMETHPKTTQFIRVEDGRAHVIIGRKHFYLKDGDAIVIPPRKRHNIISTGRKPLKLYSIYSPPEHPSGLVKKTK